MLIGIDMLAVQSPGGVGRESGRLGLGLVSALLAGDSVNRYVLYTHDALPTDRVPSARNALRVSLGSVADSVTKPRNAIQRVLDHDPDGLDWLLLLDPFAPAYGGRAPESPLNGVRIASLVTDLAPDRVDDRRIAPLRRHDAIFAASEAVIDDCRRRLPSATQRITALGPAVDPSWATNPAEPLVVASAEGLGRLGIEGPFLLASVAGGARRSNLGNILEAFQRLPLDLREPYQLVLAGELDDPWAAVAYLHDHGCAERLVMVGAVDDSTLRTLYGRCSAFIAAGQDGASTLSLVEAMACGAAIIAGTSNAQAEVVGASALLADVDNPSEIAGQVARLLYDVDLARDLRRSATDRSAQFSWEPVVKTVLGVLRGDEPTGPGPRWRLDQAHVSRPRVALFATENLGERFARALKRSFDVDLYFEPGDAHLLERLPVEFAGFDVRQFARNDGLLDYRSVIHLLPDVFSVKPRRARLRDRPGLVTFRDETSLDRIGIDDDIEAEVSCRRLRELFLTSSRLAVRSGRAFEAIRCHFPRFADQVFSLPTPGAVDEFETLAGLIVTTGNPRRTRRSRSFGRLVRPSESIRADDSRGEPR